jgi:hypothetical protein
MNPICQYNRCPRLFSLADCSSAHGVSTGSVHFSNGGVPAKVGEMQGGDSRLPVLRRLSTPLHDAAVTDSLSLPS